MLSTSTAVCTFAQHSCVYIICPTPIKMCVGLLHLLSTIVCTFAQVQKPVDVQKVTNRLRSKLWKISVLPWHAVRKSTCMHACMSWPAVSKELLATRINCTPVLLPVHEYSRTGTAEFTGFRVHITVWQHSVINMKVYIRARPAGRTRLR